MSLRDSIPSPFPWGVVYHTVTKFSCLNSSSPTPTPPAKNPALKCSSYTQFINNVTIETVHQPQVDPLKVTVI